MPFDQIRGQENATRILRNSLLHGHLAHAYLLVGPEGVGKRLTALTLAKAMNCQSPPQPGDCCETCPSCLKVNSSNHADVFAVEPEGTGIKIDQIREMQKRFRYRPVEGRNRVCILDPADQLNETAANALLKTLEEPPGETYIFLISSRPYHLLPTILSRCQWVKFRPLSQEVIIQILTQVHSLKEEDARFCASLAGGSVRKALALSGRMNFQKRVDGLGIFSDLPTKTTEEILEICEKFAKDGEEMDELLELWKFWIRDLVVFRSAGTDARRHLMNQDLAEEISRQSFRYTPDRLHSLFDLVSQVQKSVAGNANRQLALETLMLGIRKHSHRESRPGRGGALPGEARIG
jgi:DNA polymerase III subunit delta'